MSYDLKIKRKAQKSLAHISEPFQTKIIESMRKLSANPYPLQSKKLIGRSGFRIRIGDYRVIYEILGKELIILILDIAHRKDIYKK
ncbi:MAG: type II toxin-antitoxin system RelE/ParE family toxin [Spirochaetia bacterium]|jgi:mRNA interferase RelE/StbE|nr:type II toxin-antitoxin system RelE/ParE family toxin [Spirochaetia bacterium]